VEDVLSHLSNYTKASYGRWISAVAYNKDTGYTGAGFFQLDAIPGHLQRVLGRLSDEQRRLVDDERDAVWCHGWHSQ
jgi:hypothetical protein